MASDPPKVNPTGTSGSNFFGAGQSTGSNMFGSGDAGKATGTGFNFASFGTPSAAQNKTSNEATADKKPTGGFGGFGTTFGGASRLNPGEVKGGAESVPTDGSTSSAATGSTTPAPSSFSSNKPSTTPAGPPPIDVFGGSTGGNKLFGNIEKDKSTANPFQFPGVATTTGTAQPPAFGGSTFAGNASKQPLPTFSWAKSAETSQGTTPAITATTEPQKLAFSGFGQSTFNTPSSTLPSTETQKPLFGDPGQKPLNASASSAPLATSATPSIFFQPATSGASDKSQPFHFPSSTPSTAAPSASQTEGSKPLFATGPSHTPSTSAPAFSNLFNKTQTTSSATPSINSFNIGVTNTSTSTSQAPTLSTSSTATSTTPFGGQFKKPYNPGSAPTTTMSTSNPPATSTATAVPTSAAGGGTSSDLGKSVLGVSTAGPTPPVQSRLRNKTMDEILTRWASDLTKYTKEFLSQAETVAQWDQLLVENMSKISKLYISAVTAEKQTASVEMQLSAVENQQNELESWLTKYEGEVDDMLAKNGPGLGMELGGPDQERERTYKLAERLGERLEDMGRDLTSMIEEMNAVNAGLSKTTNADEPITHIVRILNSHLTQLQAIDQGTMALQAKINAAQKASHGLGFPGINGSNGTGRGAADDFYRSYMGRR